MIIWGLDLNRIRFSAFRHRNMFDAKYYLRSQRFIAYQLAMIFTVVGECLATYTLDKYALPPGSSATDLMVVGAHSELNPKLISRIYDRYLGFQKTVESYQPGASLFNNDIVGTGAFTIFAGVYTATVFVRHSYFSTININFGANP